MAFYKQDIVDINLNTGNIFRSFLAHSIGFKNDDADRFGIRCFRDGEPVDLTGASCQAVFINPLGTNIALTSYGTVSGNVAYVTLPQACYDYEGQFTLSIQLVGGGVTGTMRIVDGMVVNTGASGTVAPTASVPTYQEILAVYAQMQEDIEDYESVVANQDEKINELKSALASNVKKTEDLYNTLGYEYIFEAEGTTVGQYTRTTVLKGLKFEENTKYIIIAEPVSVTTDSYYAYIYDSEDTQIKAFSHTAGAEKIEGTYEPIATRENCSIKISADVAQAQTIRCKVYKEITTGTIVDRVNNIESNVNNVTEKEVDLYDKLGYEYITFNRVTTPGANTRVDVKTGLSLTAGEPYAVIVKPVTVTTNYYYAYLYDSNNNVLATFQVLSGQTQIDGTYIPESNLTGVSLKVSAAVSEQQTLDVAFYKRENDYCIVERVDNLFDGTKVAEYILIDRMYVKNSDGLLYADDASKASSFIPVRPGDVIEISNLYLEASRSICAYDKKQQFISAISTSTTDKKKKITVPDDAYFIRFTSQSTGTTVLKFLAIPKYIEDNAIRSIPLTITNGKFITMYPGYEGRETSDPDSACTGFVPVLPGSCICITGAKLGGNRSVCAYDTNKQFCKVIMSEAHRYSSDSKNILLPENARYIRATCEPNTPPVVKYSSYVFNDDFIIPKYISGKSLFDTAALNPVISIIDDDTWDTEYVTRIKEDLYDENNVKASFAGLTSRMENNPTLVNTLIGFEREGFPIIMHGYTQSNFYRYDPQYRDIVQCEADLVRGIHDMIKYGFADFKIWVTPFGSGDADLQKLAIKWGFMGMVDCTRPPAGFVNPQKLNAMNQYNIRRLSFDDPEDVPAAKTLIDSAALVNGWVLIATHSAATNYYNGAMDDAFAEVIQYARTNGFEVRTINEELRRRMAIYDYYSKY